MKKKTKLLLGLGIASSALAVAIPTTIMLSSCSTSNPSPNLMNVLTIVSSSTTPDNAQSQGTISTPIKSEDSSSSITITSKSNQEKYFTVGFQYMYVEGLLNQTLDPNDFFPYPTNNPGIVDAENNKKLSGITYEVVGTLPTNWSLTKEGSMQVLKTAAIDSEAKITLKATITSPATQKKFSFTFDINFVVPAA